METPTPGGFCNTPAALRLVQVPCTGIQAFRYTGVQVCRCAGVQLLCTGVQVYRRTDVQAYRYTGVQVPCTGVQAYRCTGVQAPATGLGSSVEVTL